MPTIKTKEKLCPFCDYKKQDIIFESEHFVFFKDIYPICDGHSLLIPKYHIRKELEIKHVLEYIEMSTRAWNYIDNMYSSPITFVHPPNMQTVFHLHKHFVPSKLFPVGGVKQLLENYAKNCSSLR